MFRPQLRAFTSIHPPNLILAVIVLGLVYHIFSYRQSLSETFSGAFGSPLRTLQIAVINTPLSHDEVLVPVLEALHEVPNTNVSTYMWAWRFGMDKVLQQPHFAPSLRNAMNTAEFKGAIDGSVHPVPDIVVMITCNDDMKTLNAEMTFLLEKHHTHVFCVVHHSDRMIEEKWEMQSLVTPWVRADRMDFIFLSEHVAVNTTKDRLHKDWPVVTEEHHEPKLRVFPPVFQFYAEDASTSGTQSTAGGEHEPSFSIQGEYGRGRNFKLIFEELRGFIDSAKSRGEEAAAENTKVHLLGKGKRPIVPPELEKHVIFDDSLNYTEYYTTIAHTDAVVAAFSTDEYFHLKASSSVPAALIAGTPLVANKEVLEAYTYLEQDVVWWQEEGETELDVVGRVLSMSVEEKSLKKEAIRKFNERLIRQNKANMRSWIAEAAVKFPPESIVL